MNMLAEEPDRRHLVVDADVLDVLVNIMLRVDLKVNPGYCGRAAILVALLVAEDTIQTRKIFRPCQELEFAMSVVVALMTAAINSVSYPGTSYFPQIANIARGIEALSRVPQCHTPLKNAALLEVLAQALAGCPASEAKYESDTRANLLRALWNLSFSEDTKEIPTPFKLVPLNSLRSLPY
eukprot:c17424_g1_i1.p1 GENE.c17424_g1_i1~~c17424_g1_i1.p1  ORF type:complete len:181 (+),score=25.12 c17424_g1_i1:455-997(+)